MKINVPGQAQGSSPPKVPPTGKHAAVLKSIAENEDGTAKAVFAMQAEGRDWFPEADLTVDELRSLAQTLGFSGVIDADSMVSSKLRIRIHTSGHRATSGPKLPDGRFPYLGRQSYRIVQYMGHISNA